MNYIKINIESIKLLIYMIKFISENLGIKEYER